MPGTFTGRKVQRGLCLQSYCGMLIDFKTSASVQSMLCGVQLEAYSRAYCTHAGVSEFGEAIIHLKKDGTYEMLPFGDDATECWRVFTALMTVRNYKQKYAKGR